MDANDSTTPKKKETKITQLSQTESTQSQTPPQNNTNNQQEEIVKKPSTPKRTKSPGVRVVGNRIYDSKNGKTCHQCRQKTLDVVVSCTNQTEKKKQCPLNICKSCLHNRYGENVEEVAASDDWKCPRCRGICNCSFCMKKRGFAPTGVLIHTAKQNGCASVSNLLVNINGSTVTKVTNGRKRRSKVTTDEPEKKRVKEENDSVIEENEKENMAEEDMKEDHNNVEIELPQGTELTNLEGVDLPSRDIGHALQLLEFCETFGEVLDLKKGEPEILLRELTCADAHKRNESLIVSFHIRLLSLIGEDSGEKYSGKSWVEDFKECISESKFPSKESLLEGFNLEPNNGYDEMDFSKKLRLLNFLCDEALETAKLRSWIEKRNAQEIQKAKERVIANREKEKNMKKKVQDEVAKAILLQNGTPLSISEKKDLVSRIKAETARTLANSLDMKVPRESYVVRSEPVFLDRNGCKLWKLRSNSDKVGILLQESCYGDVTCDEKWFAYNDQEKALVDQYISTSRNLRE